MKIVYYRNLISRGCNLTPTERIVYSFLVSKSITYFSDLFDSDGVCIMTEDLYDTIDDYGSIPLYQISIRKLAKELNISNQTVITSIKRLRDLEYICDDNIYVDKETICGGYFELLHSDIVSGQTLIFYSFLKDRAKKYGGCIDTYKCQLATLFCVNLSSIKQYLNKLYKVGLIERLENGKLQIN